MPFKLQEGEVRIISLEQCQSYFDMKTITTRMICAGYESGTVDSCMVNCFLVTHEIQCSSNIGGPMQSHCYSWMALLKVVTKYLVICNVSCFSQYLTNLC